MVTDDVRGSAIGELTRAPLDVLVVGGGIVGAGVARDAALRGLRVGLVEQHDFAYGTSSRSSRLLHGGIRYLAQGRIGLVHEASVEKVTLSRIAPHLAESLAFLFPTYRCVPWGPWALWKLRIGVKLYDLLCGGRNLGRSSAFSAATLQSYLPGLNPKNLTGAVRYYDGLTNDARLVIDTLRASAKAGAVVMNRCRFEEGDPQGDAWRCGIVDRVSGEHHEVVARSVVNAAGPWAAQLKHSSIRLRPTKGIHLVIDRDRLPVPDAVVITEGSRILFVIPWGERVILGTTDTDYDGVIEDVRVEPEDVNYVLGVMNEAFDHAGLTPADIVGAWAGLRPLIADPSGKPSDISRAHEIHEPKPGWFDVAGGKLTTYRLMAEQTVDRISRRLGRATPKCATAKQPLLAAQETEGVSGITPPEPSRSVVEHYCGREWADHLDDVMIRRTSWHYYRHDARALAEEVAGWMAESLGWDGVRRAEELAAYAALLDR